jgi:hypothetical protein
VQKLPIAEDRSTCFRAFGFASFDESILAFSEAFDLALRLTVGVRLPFAGPATRRFTFLLACCVIPSAVASCLAFLSARVRACRAAPPDIVGFSAGVIATLLAIRHAKSKAAL